INTERTTRALAPLVADPLLQRYAQAHANHLAATGSFAHQNLMPILNASGGRFGQAGENLFSAAGAGATDAGTAHDALMRSPTHRANILLPEERFVGVGVACAGGRMVVVQDFASPMGVTLQSHPTPPLQPRAAPSLSGARC
ncbi:MAG TPA: CAP domain-containing protein, partial [Acidimicrobiia bacterium]|nr:CAP domain-containing protein [Acidimicrobiia bacterium]